MRYFHRTSLALQEVLAEADRHFGGHMELTDTGQHRRMFSGTIGEVTVTVEAEGGHYTRVTVSTDQVGESEADSMGKRFLTLVHKRAEPAHEVRGAY